MCNRQTSLYKASPSTLSFILSSNEGVLLRLRPEKRIRGRILKRKPFLQIGHPSKLPWIQFWTFVELPWAGAVKLCSHANQRTQHFSCQSADFWRNTIKFCSIPCIHFKNTAGLLRAGRDQRYKIHVALRGVSTCYLTRASELRWISKLDCSSLILKAATNTM